MPVESSGEWREERIWVLNEIERINLELTSKTAELAVCRDHEERHLKDIHAAHARIRELQAVVRTARLKSWAATSVAAFLGVVVIELMKHILK